MPINYARRTRARRPASGSPRTSSSALRYPIEPEPGYGAPARGGAQPRRARAPAAIAAPTLVVHGDEDVLVPPENGRLLADAIPGADAAHVARRRRTSTRPTSPRPTAAILEFLSERSSPWSIVTGTPLNAPPAGPEQERDDVRDLGRLDQPLDRVRGEDHLLEHAVLAACRAPSPDRRSALSTSGVRT